MSETTLETVSVPVDLLTEAAILLYAQATIQEVIVGDFDVADPRMELGGRLYGYAHGLDDPDLSQPSLYLAAAEHAQAFVAQLVERAARIKQAAVDEIEERSDA